MAFTVYFATGWEGGFNPCSGGELQASGAHTGTYRMHCDNAAGKGPITNVPLPPESEIYITVWTIASSSAATWRVRLNISDGTYIDFRQNSSSRIELYVNGGLVQTGTIPFDTGVWVHFQAHVLISDTGTVETRMNGTPDISYSGDTKPSTGTTFSTALLHQYTNTLHAYWDDFVSGTGGWPGDLRIEKLSPTGDHLATWHTNGQSTQDAPAAPTATPGSAGVLTGTYSYKVTLVDAIGETLPGTKSSDVAPSSQVVDLSSIPTGIDGTTSRKIYRTAAGGAVWKLVDTIPDNTTTTYQDNKADINLGADAPTFTHYDKIDEIPPSDTDYLYSTTDAEQDLHDVTDWVQGTMKTPVALVQHIRAQRDSSADNNVKLVCELSDTQIVGDEEALSTAWAYFYKVYNEKPGTGAWTESDINNAKFGVESVIP